MSFSATPVNGGKAHSQGVEFELNAIPVAGLELSFGGSVTEARIDDAVPDVQAAAGATLPFVPKRQLYTSVQYTFPLPGSGSLEGRVRADARYKSDSYSDITDASSEVSAGYTQTNLRAGVVARTWDLMALSTIWRMHGARMAGSVPTCGRSFVRVPSGSHSTCISDGDHE